MCPNATQTKVSDNNPNVKKAKYYFSHKTRHNTTSKHKMCVTLSVFLCEKKKKVPKKTKKLKIVL